jgi:hypothetical protein
MSRLGRLRDDLRRPDLGRPRRFPRRADLPEPLPPGRTFVLGDPPQWAVFACPCGSGHDVMVRIDETGAWRLSTTRWRRRPTLRPSVDF